MTAFGKLMDENRSKHESSAAAQQAKDARYDPQLKTLSSTLQDGGAEGLLKVRNAMFELHAANEELYNGLMETYPALYKLFDASMSNAGAAQVLSDAFGMEAEAASASVKDILAQIQAEQDLAEAKKSHYKTTLESLKAAYATDGNAGFDKVWDGLDESAKKEIAALYGQLGDLATVAMQQGREAALTLLDDLIAQADQAGEKLRERTLTDNAQGYTDRQGAMKAKDDGFQSQLVELRDSLSDGSLLETLAGYKEALADALLADNEWLNGIIENYALIEDGTLSLTDVLTQFNEHIVGTDEQFAASAEAMAEANRNLLQSEEEQLEVLSSLYNALQDTGGLDTFKDAWNGLGEKMQEALVKKFPIVSELMSDLNKGSKDSSKSVEKLGKTIKALDLKKLQRDGKVWNE